MQTECNNTEQHTCGYACVCVCACTPLVCDETGMPPTGSNRYYSLKEIFFSG